MDWIQFYELTKQPVRNYRNTEKEKPRKGVQWKPPGTHEARMAATMDETEGAPSSGQQKKGKKLMTNNNNIKQMNGGHIPPTTPLNGAQKMKSRIYAVRDVKTEVFTKPFIFENDETARRAFVSTLHNTHDTMAQFPDDYILYRIGEWDDETGELQSVDNYRICSGVEALKHQREKQERLDELHGQISLLKDD